VRLLQIPLVERSLAAHKLSRGSSRNDFVPRRDERTDHAQCHDEKSGDCCFHYVPPLAAGTDAPRIVQRDSAVVNCQRALAGGHGGETTGEIARSMNSQGDVHLIFTGI
jgi:hypothetical protein